MENIQDFVDAIKDMYGTEIASELSYRTALEMLIRGISGGKLKVINEGKVNELDLGKPDIIVKDGDVLIGCIEAKDIDKDLSNKGYEEQFTRYKNGIENLIITNCLDWEFYKDGELKDNVTIGFLSNNRVKINEEKLDRLLFLLQKFTEYKGLKITSSKNLALIMANRSRALKIAIVGALRNDTEHSTLLYRQYDFFKKFIMKDLDIQAFSDMYAQTITYGLFVARLNTGTSSFSRDEALLGISNASPLLEGLFKYLVDNRKTDKDLNWDVDNLIELFDRTDLQKLFAAHKEKDLFVHFYEDFLDKYDKSERKSRGVFYTPVAIVNYIVNAVHEILQTEFKLDKGLADTTKTTYKYLPNSAEGSSGGKYLSRDIDRVQILDPATGTGTFLVEIVRKIYEQIENKGQWSEYVENHLLKNLHGFELLMTPYVMCNLKLSTVLRETGYEPKRGKSEGYKIFLTNSLDNTSPDEIPYLDWLNDDNKRAKHVKNFRPIKVIVGNPPYSADSFNNSEFITDLTKVYKEGLTKADQQDLENVNKKGKGIGRESNSNIRSLSDDYIKFIRLAENYVERNEEGGIVAFITNNSFLDGSTHRQMRKHLLETFDKIYVVNLHGDANKQERSPDGSKDENVFSIRQGVSINIFVKTSSSPKKELAKVYYKDLYGLRKFKYDWLHRTGLSQTDFVESNPVGNSYFFVPKDFSQEEEYNKWFGIKELFSVCATGSQTKRDDLFTDYPRNVEALKKRIKTLLSGADYPMGFVEKYNVRNSKSKNGYQLLDRIKKSTYDETNIEKYSYRPFDCRSVYYGKGLIGRATYDVMQHFLKGKNLGLCTTGELSLKIGFKHVFATTTLVDLHLLGNVTAFVCPLYCYRPLVGGEEKSPNFNREVLRTIEGKLKLKLDIDFTPENLFDYIYGVLHSNKYRTRYRTFLEVDFPRIPYPENKEYFFEMATYGEMLRNIHLLTPGAISTRSSSYIDVKYHGSDDNVVLAAREIPKFEGNRVYINETQYFDNVPEDAWNFYVGDYQPLQKWLSDRKNETLTYDDVVEHYPKMVNAIAETIRIMDEIDRVIQL